ncbi:MAG: hypothetical protein NWE83_08860, partial [Candidatus Bathyarchaeota archaeon]|nr:hypothetical protein [Candidatus Bathyarchaeota archaeon]
DWSKVSEAVKIIYDEQVDPPTQNELQENQDFLQLAANMMRRLERLEEQPVAKKKRPTKKKGRPKKKPPVEDSAFATASNRKSRNINQGRSSENQFEEMYDEIAEAGKDDGFERINDQIQNTARKNKRARKKYSKATVQCRICNKTSEVHPMFARDNYTCDGCIGKHI